MTSRTCVNHPDKFCYICGKYTLKKQGITITPFISSIYFHYFHLEIKNQDKSWVPHNACKSCVETLRQWELGKRKSMPFGIPMVWREPSNHVDDCYFCLTSIQGFNNFEMIETHDDLPKFDLSDDKTPKLFTQHALNDVVRDLGLSKESALLLASKLGERNLLASNTTFSWYKHRETEFLPFFVAKDDLVYCTNVPGLLKALGLDIYKRNEWRLFIDSSKRSLKGVLLHNGGRYACVPIAHSVHLKESYENVEILLKAIEYNKHKWQVCGDLKIVSMVLGQQSGFTKYPCFFCEWDSRAKCKHWTR
ncbi:hypothetical protein X777_13644 [Ooceraea biroi]|uniref:Uncharacterized protein n=1 Tax=Ooceraea biroi TaxID=2015173 RepID=A0A026WYH4_OOCBI|nr:hypothetical protein X777_13644 [Ooceraea biroi]